MIVCLVSFRLAQCNPIKFAAPASALLEEPAIAERNMRVVWIGGEDWPVGGWEFNLWNDVNAANVVFRSKVDLWQIPSTVYKRMAVSYAELVEKVYDKGPLGKYLVEQLVEWNKHSIPTVLSNTGRSAIRPRSA